ncbi:MAG: class B sortase [Bacilli bacterium]|nr:class B sortase [Bacilli bacterium]
MKKKKANKIIYILTIIICIPLIYISAIKITNWYSDINDNNNIKEETNKSIIIKKQEFIVDFKKLKKQNTDTVAYLKVNNTNIDYVVVKGKDNDYYLTHNFNKDYNIAGWVFATYQNKLDGTDKNIVIFGHNMRDGSMFGTLRKVFNKKWYSNKDNLTIKLVTEEGLSNYKIFSIYQIKPEDYYINTEFNSDKEFNEFIKTIKSRSMKDFKVNVNKNDQILTLSTCSMTGNERVVIHAKKI